MNVDNDFHENVCTVIFTILRKIVGNRELMESRLVLLERHSTVDLRQLL